jgi:hypothetical protein
VPWIQVLAFNILPLELFFQLVDGHDFFLIERKEHAVKLDAVSGFDPKPPSIEVFHEHVFSLIIRVKDVLKIKPEYIPSKASKIKRVVRLFYGRSKSPAQRFKLIHCSRIDLIVLELRHTILIECILIIFIIFIYGHFKGNIPRIHDLAVQLHEYLCHVLMDLRDLPKKWGHTLAFFAF